MRTFLNSLSFDFTKQSILPLRAVQLGNQDIFFVSRDIRQVKIWNLNPKEEFKRNFHSVYDGIGEQAFIFEKFGNDQIFFSDHSHTLKNFVYHSLDRTLSLLRIFKTDHSFNELLGEKLPFKRIPVTKSTILYGGKAYCFYPANSRHDYTPNRPSMIDL